MDVLNSVECCEVRSEGVRFKISLCKLCSGSLMWSFSLFVNVGVGSFSFFGVNVHHNGMCRFPSYNYLVHDSSTSPFVSWLDHNIILTFQVM